MKKFPEIICWRITSRCNRKCHFCFRPKSIDLDIKSNFKIINKLADDGVKGIGITGGEPLLREDIIKILKYIHSKGMKICLATNGDFYHQYCKKINKMIDVIGIPIEGSTGALHDVIRGQGNFNNVIKMLKTAYQKDKKIYISTVLNEKNVLDLENIENLLAPYQNQIIYWKIYEIIKYQNRPFQAMKKGISQKSFNWEKIKNLGKKLDHQKIFYVTSGTRSEASLLINPNGDAIIPQQLNNITHDIVIGNFLFDDAKEIFKKWANLINFHKYQCHKCALKCIR